VSSTALEPLELASGLVLGLVPELVPVGSAVEPSPRAALERAVLRGLARPPCVVSFSGGRDSSAVLALAASVARREGLPLPIPATNRFPAVESTDESEWQERVVAHLGLEDWIRLEHEDELDCVGPVAQRVLERHGLLWPFNTHFHVPLLELARGGSLLTGIGGDELLEVSSWTRVADVLRGRVRPEPRDLLRLGFVLAPAPVRAIVLRRRLPDPFPWLRPEAWSEFLERSAARAATEPLRWRPHVRWVRRFRYLHVGQASLRKVAAAEDAQIVHPFLDLEFAGALAQLAPRARYASRTDAMRTFFSDLLPDEVLARQSKTFFDAAFWGEPSRRFAAEWDGRGVDTSLVDVEALADVWRSEAPEPRSFLLAQAAWLTQRSRSGDRVEQAVDGVR
jgi:asparagine synthase (glutamine-hydrolysing)